MITFSELGKYGRLGNQMFQVASTLGIANSNNHQAIFPKWFCNYTKKDMSCFFKNPINQNLPDDFKAETYQEPFFHYKKVTYTGNLNLHGYFQSYKYFEECEELIRHHFTPADYVIKNLNSKYKNVLDDETCSIHVRMGDYINNPTHDMCDINYYNRAIEHVKNKGIKKFVVFSDNINWCRKEFPNDFIFIENNLKTVGIESIHRTNNSDMEEMFLMSMCNHNIIANSSFSWWGSWLNNNQNKIVIAPARWFGTNELDDTDLYTKYMLKI